MARTRGNAALIEQENLSPEEQAQMDENRTAEHTEPELPLTEPKAPEPTPTPSPATPEPAQSTPTPTPATPEGGAQQPDQKQRMVEYGALHEERERRKQEAARAQKAEQELARLSGRFATLEELARAAAQQSPTTQQPLPDVNTDPVGHFQAQLAARDQKIAQFEQWQAQQAMQAQQQQQIATIRQRAVAQEAEFAQATPDYVEAANYVQMVRNAQLASIGFTDPAQRAQQLAMEALGLADNALRRGINPAQQVYEMAKASGWHPGWKPQGAAPAAPAAAQAAPVATNGAASQAAAKKLETVVRGQQANASIGKLNGQTAPAETSIEELLKMSDEDFDKATAGDGWRKLFAS